MFSIFKFRCDFDLIFILSQTLKRLNLGALPFLGTVCSCCIFVKIFAFLSYLVTFVFVFAPFLVIILCNVLFYATSDEDSIFVVLQWNVGPISKSENSLLHCVNLKIVFAQSVLAQYWKWFSEIKSHSLFAFSNLQ